MGWIWTLPLLLTAALLAVVWPLFTRRGNAPLPAGLEGNPRAELEDHRDNLLRQIKELELEREGMAATDAALARATLEQELGEILERLDALAPAGGGATGVADAPHPASGVDRAAGIALALGVVVISGLLYLFLGTPVPPTPEQLRQASEGPDMAQAVEQLAQRLQGRPEDLEGWSMLARSYAVLGRTREAIDAYTHILERTPEDLEVALALAEVELQSDDPELFRMGVTLLRQVLLKDPDHMEALWLMGAVLYRGGEGAQAAAVWGKVLEQMKPDDPSRAKVEEAIGKARALPPSGGSP